MKKQIREVKLYIQAKKHSWQEEFEIEVNAIELDTDSSTIYLTLDTKVVHVGVPQIDEKTLTLAHIEQIHDQIKCEKANHYLRVTRMEDTINSLMCLENN